MAVSSKVEIRYTPADSSWQDITAYVTRIAVSRGKSSEFDDFQAGKVQVTVNNHGREFDPSYGGLFSAYVKPAGDVRVVSSNELVFQGKIDDWNLSYSPDGSSVASFTGSDGFIELANKTIIGYTPSAQRADQRITDILGRAEVDYDYDADKISVSVTNVGAYTIGDGTSVLQYIQSVSASEPGRLFMDKSGDLVFKSRNDALYETDYTYYRQNLSENPSFENDASSWSGSIARSVSDAYVGTACGAFSGATVYQNFSAEQNSTYTLSIYAKAQSGTPSITWNAYQSIDGAYYEGVGAQSVTLSTSAWTRLDITFTTEPDYIFGRFELFSAGAVYVDACLIEKSGQLLEYFDGSNAPDDTDTETFTASWDL